MIGLTGRCCALAVAVLLAAAAAAAEPPIRIAALYNLTGGMAPIDGPALNGASLHVAEINRDGGLLGRQVELAAFDTATDPAAARRAAVQAVADGAVAGIGYGDTTFVLAAAPVFQEHRLPFVTSGATHPELPARIGDHLFMAAFGDDDQSYAIAAHAFAELGLRRVVVWTDQSMDFTRTLSGFFRERFRALGGSIVATDDFRSGDTDFSGQIARLRAVAHADGVFVAAVPAEAGLTVKQIREAGLSLPILSADGFDTELVASVPGPALATGIWFATHAFRESDRPAVTAFVAAYRARYGLPPESAFAALGYDAVGLLADAIRRAGSAAPARLRDALAATRGYPGVTGEIGYGRAGGVPAKPVAIIAVMDGTFAEVAVLPAQP